MRSIGVLILILMDYSLRIAIAVAVAMISCLNPYSNGLLSEKYDNFNLRYTRVLILILMDYSLSTKKNTIMEKIAMS